MAIGTLQDRDLGSLVNTDGNNWARRVLGVGADGSSSSTSLGGYSFTNLISDWPFLAVGNKVLAFYPTNTTEEYSFQDSSTQILRLRVTYSNPSKKIFTALERIA
jgi:hypothetical protein